MRPTAAAWSLLSLSLFVLGSCREPQPQSHTATRFTDLMRIVKEKHRGPKGSPRIDIWSLDGDTRAILFLRAPGRLEFPFDPGQDCVFRFGMGFNRAGWKHSDGVIYKVSVKRDAGEDLLFSELLDPSAVEKRQWQDREVSIPESDSGPFTLILETKNTRQDRRTSQRGATRMSPAKRLGRSGSPRGLTLF